MQKPLILVSERISRTDSYPPLPAKTAPTKDYVAIARALHADLLGYETFDQKWGWLRKIENSLKLDLIEAISAARRLSSYNLLLSTSEKVALPLAAMLQYQRCHIPHIVISHKISSRLKKYLFQTWPLHHHFSRLICLSQTQRQYAINKLGLPPQKVDFVYDKVDHCFFKPQPQTNGDYILSVGREQRDYPTLLEAIKGTNLNLKILANSPWSTYKVKLETATNLELINTVSDEELKQLYAGARLVVTPLLDVDYAAGVNTVLEAMAMAKPVIVTQTQGLADYVQPDQTGVLVAPGNAPELRDAILSLWHNAPARHNLGDNARAAVETSMNLNIYVDRISKIVAEELDIASR